MTSRKAILARIREALHQEAKKRLPLDSISRRPVEVLPKAGCGLREMLEQFAHHAKDLKARFCLHDSEEAAFDQLKAIAAAESWRKVGGQGNSPVVSAAAEILGLPVIWTHKGYEVRELESCDAGFTECECLIAQTGSLVVTSRGAGGRALSVLPPHHVVLARRDQLLPDLPSAFAFLEKKLGHNYPSMISLVTGPSRTGDIERILVLGAHGPKQLTILCW